MHLRELDANLVVVLDALLAETSVSRAAARLGRSPSAISHALAHLRDVFEDDLFVRAGQKLVPTAKALQLAPTIHVIVSGLEGLLRPDTPFDPENQSGTYHIACHDSVELTVLDGLRTMLRSRAPGLNLDWTPYHPSQSLRDLRDGDTDFVLFEGEITEHAADFRLHPLFDETYVTLGRPSHALSGRAPSIEEFSQTEQILIASASTSPHPLEVHLSAHGIAPVKITRVSSAFVGMFIAWRSDSLITVPRTLAGTVAEQLPFAHIQQPFPMHSAKNTLVWHRRHERDECHDWLRQQIIEHAELLAPKAAADNIEKERPDP